MHNASNKYPYNTTDFNSALSTLKTGGIILYPTDTIWGIGCDATNDNAVNRIYALKQRCETKSMLSLLPSIKDIDKWFVNVPSEVTKILSNTNQPTTLILDNPLGVSKSLISDDNSLGIRITSEIFTHNLSKELGRPLVSTSANISGLPSPKYFHEIDDAIIKGVDYIVQYRRDDFSVHKPSIILKIHNNKIITIRK